MDLKERVRRAITEQGLIGPEDTVLCGVYGGADSLCLFLLNLLFLYVFLHPNFVAQVHIIKFLSSILSSKNQVPSNIEKRPPNTVSRIAVTTITAITMPI